MQGGEKTCMLVTVISENEGRVEIMKDVDALLKYKKLLTGDASDASEERTLRRIDNGN